MTATCTVHYGVPTRRNYGNVGCIRQLLRVLRACGRGKMCSAADYRAAQETKLALTRPALHVVIALELWHEVAAPRALLPALDRHSQHLRIHTRQASSHTSMYLHCFVREEHTRGSRTVEVVISRDLLPTNITHERVAHGARHLIATGNCTLSVSGTSTSSASQFSKQCILAQTTIPASQDALF